jgi:hypothetical protein
MKAVSIVLILLLIVANGAAFLPPSAALQPYEPYLSAPYLPGATIMLGVFAMIAVLLIRGRLQDVARPVAEAARPVAVPTHAARAEAEIVSLLATLQERGRLVDFVMEDINGTDDAQVGAAARVVHAGCRAALDEHFSIRPVRMESEGSTVRVEAGYPADEYRLLGKISGPAPFSGVLVHHGWITDSVKLPRILRGSDDRLPAIAPAEVELR